MNENVLRENISLYFGGVFDFIRIVLMLVSYRLITLFHCVELTIDLLEIYASILRDFLTCFGSSKLFEILINGECVRHAAVPFIRKFSWFATNNNKNYTFRHQSCWIKSFRQSRIHHRKESVSFSIYFLQYVTYLISQWKTN